MRLERLQLGLRFCCSKLAIASCGIGLCCPCLAELFSDQSDRYQYHDTRLDFIPVQLMDDNALLAAAEMRRDSMMSNEVRLLNSQWLLQSKRNTWSGGSAVGKFFKTTFKQFWSARNNLDANILAHHSHLSDDTAFFGQYAFELSEDKVLIGVRLQF